MDYEEGVDGGGGSDIEAVVTLGIEPQEGARNAAGWAGWEVKRTRSFASAKEDWIDTKKLLGRYRNPRLELAMTREGDVYTGSWTFSLEVKIGPYRIHKDGKVVLQLLSGSTVLLSVKAPGFARACGDWRTETWSGSLTPEQFDALSGVSGSGDVELRLC